jgi:biotin operon repressor
MVSRTSRLFMLLDALRGYRRPVTATRLAEALSVSLRTIYRDIGTLVELGAPIDGEAGIGYVLRAGSFRRSCSPKMSWKRHAPGRAGQAVAGGTEDPAARTHLTGTVRSMAQTPAQLVCTHRGSGVLAEDSPAPRVAA